VEDMQIQIDTTQRALEETQEQQREANTELVRLEKAGMADSEKAQALRETLIVLKKQQDKQSQSIVTMKASVSANTSDIQAMKTSESGRNKAVDRLNKSYEDIDKKTREKIQQVGSDPEEKEGE